jgi:hypothetical protein
MSTGDDHEGRVDDDDIRPKNSPATEIAATCEIQI